MQSDKAELRPSHDRRHPVLQALLAANPGPTFAPEWRMDTLRARAGVASDHRLPGTQDHDHPRAVAFAPVSRAESLCLTGPGPM